MANVFWLNVGQLDGYVFCFRSKRGVQLPL
jgi:hypothetical protein